MQIKKKERKETSVFANVLWARSVPTRSTQRASALTNLIERMEIRQPVKWKYKIIFLSAAACGGAGGERKGKQHDVQVLCVKGQRRRHDKCTTFPSSRCKPNPKQVCVSECVHTEVSIGIGLTLLQFLFQTSSIRLQLPHSFSPSKLSK